VSDNSQSPSRVRAQAIVLLALAFLAGAFAGGAIERVSRGRRADRPSRGLYIAGAGRGGYGGRGGGAGFPSIYDSLNLSGAQRAAIDSIMTSRRPASDSLRRAMGKNMDETRVAVESVFSPAQRAKADSMRARPDSGRRRPF
jgi:Spy/CpxP family protein refolding chaperone